MKRIIQIFFTLIIFSPLVVNASSVDMTCNLGKTTVDGGEEISCQLTLESEEKINYIKANFTATANLEYDDYESSDNWEILDIDGDTFELKNKQGGSSSESNAITLKFRVITAKANSSLSLYLKNITLTTTSNTDIQMKDITKTFKVNSCSNGLSSIYIPGITLSPYFNIDEVYYESSTNDSNITITANRQCSTSTITGDGIHELKYGLNTIEVKVTSPLGIANIYTFSITRNDIRSTENNIKSLSVNDEPLDFKPDILSYSYKVDNLVTEVKIGYEKVDATSTVIIEGNTNLKVGSNTILVKITSESGTTKEYTIYVTRSANENLFLKSLSIAKLDIDFSPDKLIYDIKTNKIFKTLDISFEKSDSNHSVIIIGNEVLKKGTNKIVIRVENETGEIQDYIINLTQERNYTLFYIIGAVIVIILVGYSIFKKYRKYSVLDDNVDVSEKVELPKPVIKE